MKHPCLAPWPDEFQVPFKVELGIAGSSCRVHRNGRTIATCPNRATALAVCDALNAYDNGEG